jgi:hypothetical protein
VSHRKFDCISVFMDLCIVFCDKLVVVIFYRFWVVIVKRYYNEVLINNSLGHLLSLSIILNN